MVIPVGMTEYLLGNNLPRISLIRGKLFPRQFFYILFPPIDLLISAFVAVNRVGCLGVADVYTEEKKETKEKKGK